MAYNPDNIFAKIIHGEIDCDKLYEDEVALAFRDISPAAKSHILVIPKGEYVSFDDFMAQADTESVTGFWQAVRAVAQQEGLGDNGYRLITNHGADASQTVPHFHVHILGGQPLGGLLASDTLNR